MTVDDLARLMGMREAAASVALDGEGVGQTQCGEPTAMSEEPDLTNIDRLRIGALHVEPPFADEDLLDEITALETEVERLRAEVRHHEQVMVENMNFDGITLEAAFRHPLFAGMGQLFYTILELQGAPNYVEITCCAADRNDGLHDIVLTARRKEGKTPDELKREAYAEVARLRARNVELVKMLRRLEWYGSDGETYWCPACGEYDHEGHLEDCSLAAALKEASDE
jgi:hypothetical protein